MREFQASFGVARENRGMTDKVGAQSATATFEQFVAAINSHDVAALTALMSPNHLFIDSLGNRVEGAKAMESGWTEYFKMCPDYWIRVDTLISELDVVLAAGETGGTIDGVAWRIPAAWRAITRNGILFQWQVFADNKPVYEILDGRRR